MTAFNPMASEHKRGKDGLRAATRLQSLCRRPATSPEMGTPAWQAWAGAGEVLNEIEPAGCEHD